MEQVLLEKIKPEELLTKESFEEALKALTGQGVTEEFSAPPVGDLYIRIVHRPFRIDPSQMIYIINLDQVYENLYNDDLYWRSEPAKFCHGAPTYEEALAAVQKLLDFRLDKWESKSKVLNIPWDPKTPDFDS